MRPRDSIRIVRYVSGSDGAGGRTKQSEAELLSCMAEVKQLKAPQRLDLLQQKLEQIIQVKFWQRQIEPLRAGDVLIWKEQTWKLQGPDVPDDFRDLVRVLTCIRQ